MLEINSAIDDEAQNLNIPFAAGQTFTLIFDSLGPEFHPLLAANGARFQGITVQSVPEPATATLAPISFFTWTFGRIVPNKHRLSA